MAVKERYFNSNKYLSYHGYWGRSGNWEYCDGGYAVSFRQRVEGKQDKGDDTALNGICLKCNNGREICSRTGPWGGWAGSQHCSAGYKGSDFKIESKQGEGDDTAANGLKLFCASGGSHVTSNMGPWGSWQGRQYCHNGQRICGIKTRVERVLGNGNKEDDTALNGVYLRCCGKVSSVHVQLVEVFSRQGDDDSDSLQQIRSSAGLMSSSGHYSTIYDSTSTIYDIAWRVQSVADYSEAVASVTSEGNLAELVKIALMSPLYERHGSTSAALSVNLDANVDVYAYVGEATVTMSDGSTFKFRGKEVVKSTEPLNTSSLEIKY